MIFAGKTVIFGFFSLSLFTNFGVFEQIKLYFTICGRVRNLSGDRPARVSSESHVLVRFHIVKQTIRKVDNKTEAIWPQILKYILAFLAYDDDAHIKEAIFNLRKWHFYSLYLPCDDGSVHFCQIMLSWFQIHITTLSGESFTLLNKGNKCS